MFIFNYITGVYVITFFNEILADGGSSALIAVLGLFVAMLSLIVQLKQQTK